jgi:hypothetical protein
LATHLYNEAQLSLKKAEIEGQLELKKEEIDGQLTLKEHEESRHTKVELTQALDKYAHYMFSNDPQQREFGYNLFTQLGYPEIALKLARTTGDEAVRKVAESIATSSDPAIRSEATQTLAVLTSGQRNTIRSMLLRDEGTKYDTIVLEPTGLYFGVCGCSLKTGDLEKLLLTYTAEPGAAHSADLQPFIDRVKAHDETLANDPAFRSALKSAGSDSVMHKIEDSFLDRDLDESITLSAKYALRLPLSVAIIHDTKINQGAGAVMRFAAATSAAVGGTPASGIAEEVWTTKFINLRVADLKQNHSQFVGLLARAQRYAALASRGDWWLENSAGEGQVSNTDPARQ